MNKNSIKNLSIFNEKKKEKKIKEKKEGILY